jgi:hypothetical protein
VISGPLFPESWVELDAEVAAAEAAWLHGNSSTAGAGVTVQVLPDGSSTSG